ncbi:unnamed protein product [Effrenium voratum]|uniref:Uncharacterized protein n=1 Tax=Effrenium voratum TaxID=2562239 RepID=A0AA36MX96_9DINO|nr:unnamed protein product [Effrenium voratum]
MGSSKGAGGNAQQGRGRGHRVQHAQSGLANRACGAAVQVRGHIPENGGQGHTGARHPREPVRPDRAGRVAVHAPHRVRQQGGRGCGTSRSGHRPQHGHDQGEEGGGSELAAIRAGRAAGKVGSRGQRHPDVRVPLPEQGGIPADHAQHLQSLRQPPAGGARLRSKGQGRKGPQHGAALLRAAAILRVPDPQGCHQEGQQGAQLGGLSGGGHGGPLVKERFLTTPLACNSWVTTKSRSRSWRRSRGREREPRMDCSKGRNKGKPKGKGASGKSKGGNAQEGAWHSTTPDGRQICYKFNNPQERCRGPCNRVAPAGQEEPGRTFNVLYLFSGEERKNPDHDLTDKGKRQGILEQIKGGKYAVIIVTPPCGTWSRYETKQGLGAWLSEKLQKRADEGNIMIVLFIDILMLLGTTWCNLIARRPYFLGEHPEDLGGLHSPVAQGKWVRPASIWKLPDLRNAAEKLEGMQSIALHQCNWGAPTPKPTRLLTDLPLHASFLYNQWPQLDGQGRYLGPLPRHCGHIHKYGLAKQHPEEAFRTPAASTYPADMDAALAAAINQVLLKAPHLTKPPAEGKATIKDSPEGKVAWDVGKETDGDIKEGKFSGEKDFEVKGFWGVGRPMQACYRGKKRGVHDGGGLCSPGRWRVGARNFPEGTHFCEIREIITKFFKGWLSQERGQETFWQMAAGRLTGSPFEKFVDGCRREVDVKLASLGSEVTRQGTDRITEIHYRRMEALLRVAEDPDHQFLIPLVETGVDLGVDEEMPRVPAVFEAKVKWNLEEVDDPFKEVWCENYGSAVDNMEDIRRQVEEDIERGHVIRMDKQAAGEKFGGRLAVASLGAVPKELGSSKVRIIHATHEVMINHRIRAMVRQMKADHAANPAVRLLMKYDVSRAHKLVPVKEQDWPLMAFSLERPEEVFMHTVGAFGFGSAAYWWQRVAAAVTRLAHYLSAGAYELYHDDGLLGAHGADCWRRILYWFFVMDVVEVPITWKKVAGGARLGWIGYEADIQHYLKGIGDSKVAWVLGWIKEVKDEGSILGSRMRSALGRLSFVAGALVQVRPFLGVIFAWTSRLQPGGFHQVPMAVQIVLEFIKVEITRRPLTEPRPLPKKVGELFRVDAKAEGHLVVVGGWESFGGRATAEARWFSLKLTRKTAPWAYVKGEPFRVIASLDRSGETRVVQGFTDSLVNTHVIDHYMSTAFPLSVVLMELAVQLGELGTTLQLGWTPREQNEEADALTNLDFSLFNPDLRVRLELDELGFKVIPKIMEAATQLDSEIRLEKDKRKKGKEHHDKNSAKKPKKAEMRWKEPWPYVVEEILAEVSQATARRGWEKLSFIGPPVFDTG